MSELKKLNVDGAVVKTPEELATYKPIPEMDTDFKTKPNSNMVKENGDSCGEGADEKMLAEELKKLSPKSDVAEVKFLAGDHTNGDAKIDILDVKQAFTGLTKEELMKYCNDPFWVRLRWIMFVGFWLAWLGMLAGAIVIIVGAPKCAPPPPKTWWEQGPLLEAEMPLEELAGLQDSLLGSLEVKGVIIDLKATDAYSETPPDVAEKIKAFADKANKDKIRVVLDLTPNFISSDSDWFNKSEHQEMPYKDYFVWSAEAGSSNWVSTLNESAWSFSPVRKQYYLHQFKNSTPDLNFRNNEVVQEFDKVLKFWVDNGVSGFRLSKVKHLLVDKDFANETESKLKMEQSFLHTDYGYYSHSKTTHQEGLEEILLHWKAIVNQHTEDQGVLTLKEDLESVQGLLYNGSVVVDLPRASRPLAQKTSTIRPSQGSPANALQRALQNSFLLLGNDSWPAWQYTSNDDKLSSELAIITMLLPGSPIVTLDQITVTDNSSESNLKVSEEFASLVKLRALPSMLHGGYDSFLLANGTVFAFTRLKSGNPGCMVLFNPSVTEVHADVSALGGVPAELTVQLLSRNYVNPNVLIKGKLPSQDVPISANSAIVLTYVSAKE